MSCGFGIFACRKLAHCFRVAQVIVNSEPSAKMAARPDSPASMGLMPSAFTDTTFVFPVVVNGATEVCKATPRLTRLVSKLAETPLMSVQVARASIRVSARIPLSSALPVTTLASVCAGTEDSSSAFGSVPAYEAVLVQEFTPEPTPANEFVLQSPLQSGNPSNPLKSLLQSGSSESTPEPAPVREPSESTPELVPVQEPSEFAHETAPV